MYLRTILALAIPGAMVLLIALAALMLAPDAPLLVQATRGYPYIALSVAALLAWRMNASRIFIASVLVAATHLAMQPGALGSVVVAGELTTVILPLVLALLVLTRDVSITSAPARSQYALGLYTVTAIAVLSALTPQGTLRLLTYDWIDPVYTHWTPLSPTPLLAATLALTALAVNGWRSRSAAAAGLLWTTLAVVCAFAERPGSVARGIWVLAAGTVLVIALVESSHFMAYHDELTRLPGRRALAQMLASLRAPYSIAVVDVDHFKSFNDRYGHDVGDEVLQMVAVKLSAVSGGGIPFRSGGEEFVIVFPGVVKPDAVAHLEALRAAVADTAFTVRKKPRPRGSRASAERGTGKGSAQRLHVTISIGIASPGRTSGVDLVLKSADKAMYRAKNAGRNRVVA